MFGCVDRLSELESWRRSIAMAPPRSAALDREKTLALIAELEGAQARLEALLDGLRQLLAESRGG